jgi:small-conductance mechanosensitive channel
MNMSKSKFAILALAGLMATSLMSTAWAKQAHVDKTISSISTSKAIPVTWKNFVRAESDKMLKSYVDMSGQHAPEVLLTEFADSAVNYKISVWIEDPWIGGRIKSQLNEAIWWGLKDAGIVIAFPQLAVHLGEGK